MLKTKSKKLLLSIGTISIVASSAIAFVVSCGEEKNKKPTQEDQYQPRNISRDSFSRKGGLISDEIAKNDYALLKDLIFSMLSDKGEIKKDLMEKLFGPILPRFIFPKKENEGDLEYKIRLRQTREKINGQLNKVNQKTLVNAIKVLINKGASAKTKELKPIKDMVGQFASPAEATKTGYIIDLVFEAFKSNGLVEYIKNKGGLFNFIIKIAGPIPLAFKTVVDSMGVGTENKTWTQLLGELQVALKGLITDSELKTILGLSDTSEGGFLTTIFSETLLKSPTSFLVDNNSKIQATINKLEEVKDDEPKKKTKTFNILKSHYEKTKTLLEEKKNIIAYTGKNPQVPFLNGKGVLGSSSLNGPTSLEDLTNNLTFLQTQIQKALIYFSNVVNWDKDEPTLEIDELTKDLTQQQKKKTNEIVSKIRTTIHDKQLWTFASLDLSKPTKFLHKLMNQKFDSINFTGNTTTEFNDFINYLLKIFEFGGNLNLNSNQAKAFFKMINTGLKSVANEKEHAEVAFRKIGFKLATKSLGAQGSPIVIGLLTLIVFGSQQTS